MATPHDRVSLNHALKYFPLVGWLVGGVCAFTLHLAAGVWPIAVAVVISVGVGVLLTGALHEDGFADSCDGFGGGWNKAQVLDIMKDPRIGNYAAIGLLLMLALKLFALVALAGESIELAMISLLLAHSASRWLVLPLPWLLDYVRDGDDSKSRDVVEQRFSAPLFAVSSLFVVMPLLIFGVPLFYQAVISAAAAVLALALYFRHRIGGYTGDCLGATQQVAEVAIYLAILGPWTSL